MQLNKEVYLIPSCKKSVQSPRWLLWNKDVKSKVAAKDWQKNHFLQLGLLFMQVLFWPICEAFLSVDFSMIDECG